LEATSDRFSVGEVTRTDVSQAEARLARAKADRIQAEGDLENARTTFERVIGMPPADLKSPALKYELPETLESAINEASKKSPNVVSAFFIEKAAQKNVKKITGELLPEVNLEGSFRKSADEASAGATNESAQILATLRIPLYQQGAVSSRVREAKEQAAQWRLTYLDEQRAAVETSRTAWEDLQTARARIEAFKIEIESSDIALEGVRQEANVGSRTVLDVLDAEQELLDAQVNLVRAERDEFVAATELAAAVGKLTAKEYNLDVNYYNESEYYNKVRDRIYGFGK
jgi:outer membrane protein